MDSVSIVILDKHESRANMLVKAVLTANKNLRPNTIIPNGPKATSSMS